MIVSVNGRDAYAYTGGRELDPGKPTVAFVHGAALDHTVWTLPARHFARHGMNVVATDLPGHGLSAGSSCSSIGDYADWLDALLEALGIEACAVVGHSMGSLISLDAAARFPKRFRALVLIGVAVPMRVTDALLDFASENRHVAIDLLTSGGHSPNAHLGGCENPGMWMLGGFMRLMERAAPGVLHGDLNACNGYVDGVDAAGKVNCHATLILGEKDRLTPAKAARELASALPSSETCVLPETGHAIMTERSDMLLDLLRRSVMETQ